MKKLLIALFCAAFAYGDARPTQDDFHACYQKNKSSIVSVNGNFGVAITQNLIAVPKNSQTKINDYIKFDPYLGLYLVRSSVTLEPPVMVDETDETKIKKSTWVGILDDANNTIMGHIKSLGVNLGDFDTLSFDSNVTGELNSACCKMVGIAIGGDKFIPNRYLKHFAAHEDVYYGDIGVVFTQNDKGFFVLSSDPIGRGKELMKGDEILEVNGKKPLSLREINEAILFAPKDYIVEFKVKREGEEMKFLVKVAGHTTATKSLNLDINETSAPNIDLKSLFNVVEESPSELLNDEVLRKYGIVVDKNLRVTKVFEDTPAAAFGLAVGDTILQVDKIAVKNKKELLERIPEAKSFYLLFTRNDFNFFAKVPYE